MEPRYTRVMTPRGVRDFLPPEVARKRAVETALRTTFHRWGYEEVITPTVEFLESLTQSNGPDLSEKMYRLFDREGHTLALRPEVTTPIARIAATRLRQEPLPIRLHYVANVFRHEELQAGRQREFWQAGVELVGARSAAADAEVIALAVTALEAAGLRHFRLDIGQVGFFNGIVAGVALDRDVHRSLRRALLQRDYVALPDVIAATKLPADKQRLLNELPKLQGREDVLERALVLADNEMSRAAAENAVEIFEALGAYGVQDRVYVDFGMIKDLDYYTGMVLEGYTPDIGFPVCTGGRYDHLIGRFGYDCPATGFVVGVERIMLALERQGVPMDDERGAGRWLIASDADGRTRALEEAARLRSEGATVVVDVMERSPEDMPAYARAREFDHLALFTEGERRMFSAPDFNASVDGADHERGRDGRAGDASC